MSKTKFKHHPDGLVEVIRDPPFYWDRELKPISVHRWAELFGDDAYRFLREITIQTNTGLVVASIKTIWVGHDLMIGPPEIYVFETKVEDSTGVELTPHRTEQDALAFFKAETKRQQARAAKIEASKERADGSD